MSNHKRFGVWMDSIHATVVGNNDEDELVIVAHIKSEACFIPLSQGKEMKACI